MNWRWYITGLIVAFALYGIGLEQSAYDPNQEIVVRFNAHSITASDAQDAISEITGQLKAIGVEYVQVSEIVDGKVSVSYYSTIDVEVIKNLLSRQNSLSLNHTAFNNTAVPTKTPFGDSHSYKLEILKISTDTSVDLGFHGLVVEVKSAADQFLKPKLSTGFSEIHFNPKDNFEAQKSPVCAHLIVLIDRATYKIPQVRAGPVS